MELFRRVIFFVVARDAGWFLLKPFSRLGSYLLQIRNEIEYRRAVLEEQRFHEDLFVNIFQTRKVLHGPFTGIQYPSYNAIGSALYPKLLGSYERELHGVIREIERSDYSEILNIGCGEGYYAIGFARKYPNARVFAYDTDSHALELCRQMADLNGVSKQINFGLKFDADDLGNFQFSGRGLILCDCEGFEKQLFNESNVQNLANCHLVIEIHDFIDIYISSRLRDVFSRTHMVQVVKSIDDIEKVQRYRYPETDDMDLDKRKQLFGERRPAIMEWFYLTPRAVT